MDYDFSFLSLSFRIQQSLGHALCVWTPAEQVREVWSLDLEQDFCGTALFQSHHLHFSTLSASGCCGVGDVVQVDIRVLLEESKHFCLSSPGKQVAMASLFYSM